MEEIVNLLHWKMYLTFIVMKEEDDKLEWKK